MLTSPVSSPAEWTWTIAPATDLPKAIVGAFASTASGSGGSTTPEVSPDILSGSTNSDKSVLFPFTGYFAHKKEESVHWVWGRPATVAQFNELRSRMTKGNPLIAIRFTHDDSAETDAFPAGGVPIGDPVTLDGSAGINVTSVAIAATYPGAPNMDTLSVLQDLLGLLNAAAAAGDAIDTLADWTGFLSSMDNLDAPLRLLEPGGRPVSGREITLERPAPLGNASGTLDASHRGNVLSALGVSRNEVPAGSVLRLDAGTNDLTVVTPGSPPAADQVAVDSDTAHVDVTALQDWFGPQGSNALAEFNRGCTVTPFINGPEYFDHLFAELHDLSNQALPPLFYLTGYSMHHKPKLASQAAGLTHRTLKDVAESIAGANGEARFLALQLLQLEEGFTDDVETTALYLAIILAIAGGVATGFQDSSKAATVSFFGYTQLMAALIVANSGNLDQIIDFLNLEFNEDTVSALAAIQDIESHLDPYPQECPDNPLCNGAHGLVSLVHQAQRRFNVFHQKIAVVRNNSGLHAYCGGIDLNPNRIDDRDHGIRSPYHDVHARVDGAAAAELAITFSERWARTGATELEVDKQGAFDNLPTNGSDIVQIGRTYFGPDLNDTSRALGFAPAGERTILDTTLKAIERARRYIYIEDQYLTPPPDFADALIGAAAAVSGPLIIVIPETPDQPFGFAPRQKFILDLADAWGDRLKVGTMRSRFARAQTNATVGVGRLWLTEQVEEGDTTIKIGPSNRVPSAPFWLVVGKEAMRVHGTVPGTRTAAQVEVRVDRDEGTNLFGRDKGTKRAKHKKNAAVCAGNFASIYVHSKMMLVDDVFASIGSANINRRGYYSDGECNIFALREELYHGDNWIRRLRTRLWSELAGVSEEYGNVAFVDPASHVKLFDRKFNKGNRFSPFEAQPYNTEFEIKADLDENASALSAALFVFKLWGSFAQMIAGSESETLFDSIIDPSSEVE